jgi:hypothetical protein
LIILYIILLSKEERSMEENDALYISASKANIDRYIAANNYRSAFGLLLLVLNRLDDGNQKNDFISHYLNDLFTLKPNDSPLNPR